MDSRLLIGPGIPTPDPTARAPWYVTSIGPHRLLELPPVTTAVSLTACLFSFCLVLGGTPGGWGVLEHPSGTRGGSARRRRVSSAPAACGTSGCGATRLSNAWRSFMKQVMNGGMEE